MPHSVLCLPELWGTLNQVQRSPHVCLCARIVTHSMCVCCPSPQTPRHAPLSPSHHLLQDIDPLSTLPRLTTLCLTGNPVAVKKEYRWGGVGWCEPCVLLHSHKPVFLLLPCCWCILPACTLWCCRECLLISPQLAVIKYTHSWDTSGRLAPIACAQTLQSSSVIVFVLLVVVAALDPAGCMPSADAHTSRCWTGRRSNKRLVAGH